MPNVVQNIVPIRWDDAKGEIVWLDCTKIPWKESYVSSKSLRRLVTAIKKLEMRGAPILGEAGAYGVALIANGSPDSNKLILKNVTEYGQLLAEARPTAVNLSWGVKQIQDRIRNEIDNGASPAEIKRSAITAAKKLQEDNITATYKIGEHGKHLINDGDVLVTVCNAGTLAIDGIGSATAPMRTAWAEGKRFKVLVTYTAPLYQGARLTAWELRKDGIPFKVITDNATGHLIREEKVTAAWAGADRILTDGNVYNKIGTFNLGVLLNHLGGDLYVAAPTSTIDPRSRVDEVKIEQRDQDEVRRVMGKVLITPEGAEALNPAFDRTPPELVSSIVTELGVAKKPYAKSIADILSKEESMSK
jgi:S-methyl-5-thioribose-1-phosphate isomerase